MNTPAAAPAPEPGPALLWRMLRPGFLALTASGVLMGMALAHACGHTVNPWLAVAVLLLACMAHGGANVLNDYHDALNGADAANTQGLYPYTGGARLIQNGEVSVQHTRQLAWALLAMVVPAGLWLAVRTGGGLLLVGALGLTLGWAYSAPPLALMRRGLGELAVGAAWSLVVVGADYVFRHQFFVIPSLMSLSFGLLAANVLLINGFPDAVADAQVGKRTLAVRLGPEGAALLHLVLGLLAHLWLALLCVWLIAPGAALWGLLSAPLALASSVQLMRQRRRPQALAPAIRLSIAAALLHGLAVAGGLFMLR